MSGRKIPKFSPLCQDYIRHTSFSPKFVRIVHQGSKIAKTVGINPSGFQNSPRAVRNDSSNGEEPFRLNSNGRL
jgi:hypothetical protein